jgi:ketosteroid isomerase-like protein
MSQENVELTYRAFDAFNRRDLDAFLALMDGGVEVFTVLVPMEGGYHGHDGVRRWWDSWLDTVPDLRADLVEVRDVGDGLAVAAVRIHGRGGGSEVPFEATLWFTGRWQRGKCVWWSSFRTRAEALEAVGLSQQDAHADS